MTATDTYLLLRAFCDELARCGLEHACTSPGSRNTPILLSLTREPRIRCWSHIDERCAAFFALGAAKAAGRPVALTCTSGTAAANYAPAVIEAWQARVPLIVLTADRPPELRDNGAGQAIDQVKLYGDAVKWFCEVGVDTATPDTLRWIRQLACRAYQTAASGRPGPVHLNFPLREPLILDAPLSEDPVPGRADGRPWVQRAPALGAAAPADPAVPPARGVIVAGRLERDAAVGQAAAGCARRLGWPVLADPLSGARHGATAIATYDLLLRDAGFGQRVRPELVVRVGDLPTSKPLRAWLASLSGVEQLSLDPDGAWQDPAAAVSDVDAGDPVAALEALAEAGPALADPAWLTGWTDADAAARAALSDGLGADTLSEPLTARLVGASLGPEATLIVASSMPIRDAELYLPAGTRGPRILSNRGANGIDGTVSTAFGVAAASNHPVTLLIGDVALAHDIGGLIAARQLGLDLTIVVLNNDGGGIFHFLPVSGEADAFEEHVATPHGLDFAKAAALYGLEYTRAQTAAQLTDAITRPGIVEVRTDRAENLDLHRRLADAALEAVRALKVSPTAPAASPAA
ncbi:MAG TPA: 2-succinyl-5-enolpyruvyl-6-hydroxy-3-cyclohexene-1-carboxylic-acid synthase [Solirubrobacteraceae bacterium]|nr:2-succinyl-5-enolpyruvyl-6-hydroxy-3-cyclohexene-1-carboxylic-acid synthase [Solirubrobacteraceae bacterium]